MRALEKLISITTISALTMVLAGCAASTDREAASVSDASMMQIVELPPSNESIDMFVGQLGEFVTFPDDKEYVLESSNTDVVDVFSGYTDDSGVVIEGHGVIALSIGVAEITVYDPELAGDPFERFRIFVTQAPDPAAE